MKRMLNRRELLAGTSVVTVATAAAMLGERLQSADDAIASGGPDIGKQVKHSVCKWCYGGIALDDLCRAGREFGLQSVEIIGPESRPILDKYGMTCAMTVNPTVQAPDGQSVGGISRGWNQPQYHDVLVDAFTPRIRDAADAGFDNVICFSGNRRGMDDEQGMMNCAQGIQRLMPVCEKMGVTLCMELLNSKRDHRDYMCDRTVWGVELVKRVGSENFKLLYDIYHMQIMEGDVIATIREYHPYIGHYHTGGVPGRAEIDDTQELNYPAIVRAISESGYDGFIGQEFIPRRSDKIASLKQGVTICDVG